MGSNPTPATIPSITLSPTRSTAFNTILSLCAVAILGLNPFTITAASASDASTVLNVAPQTTTMPASRAEWMNASTSQRISLSEAYGMNGARLYSMQQGWQPLLDGTPRSIPQGPDQVYRAGRLVHVIEAKGGTSPLGHAYGHPQGSTEWAVRSAERVLRSPASTEVERRAMRKVLQAAGDGRLRVHVVRTPHVLGLPGHPILQQTAGHTDEAARLAKGVLQSLTPRPVSLVRTTVAQTDDLGRAATSSIDDVARAGLNQVDDAGRAGAAGASGTRATALRIVGRGLVVVGVAVDAGLRINEGANVEADFRAGRVDQQQREVRHVGNAAGAVGGWGGAWAGAKLGAMGGGAAGAACGGVGAPVGAVAGGIVGGVAGYVGGEQAAKAGAEWTVRQVHAAGTTIADGAAATWEGTKAAGSWVGGQASAASSAVAGGAKAAWNWVTDW